MYLSVSKGCVFTHMITSGMRLLEKSSREKGRA